MKVTWIIPGSDDIAAEVPEGQTLMEAAVAAGVPHILGECGGTLSCATCHVVVDPAWRDKAGGAGEFEEAMLDVTEAERQAGSRLSCQMPMGAALDGLVLRVPQP